MFKVFRDWFTGGDGETYDIGRWLWFLSVNSYIGLTCVQMYRVGGTIDFVAWGGGLAALLGAGGAALGLKANTEPKPSMSFTTMTDTPNGSSATNVSINTPAPAPPAPPVVVVAPAPPPPPPPAPPPVPTTIVATPASSDSVDTATFNPPVKPKRTRKPKAP